MFKIQYRRILSFLPISMTDNHITVPAEVGEWFDWVWEGEKPQEFARLTEAKKNLFQTMFDAIQESSGPSFRPNELTIQSFQSTCVEENYIIYEFIFGDARRWQFRFLKIENASPWKIGLNDDSV